MDAAICIDNVLYTCRDKNDFITLVCKVLKKEDIDLVQRDQLERLYELAIEDKEAEITQLKEELQDKDDEIKSIQDELDVYYDKDND